MSTCAMKQSSVGTYLRFLRRKSGLSQRDLAQLLGSVTESQVSRHERSISSPSLPMAFAYQVVFRRPASDIFPGLYDTVDAAVSERIAEFGIAIGNRDVKGGKAEAIARQLEWLWERANPEVPESNN